METEIWPNLYHQAARRNVPLLIANARISQGSFKNYLRFRRITEEALVQASFIAAQSHTDAKRLLELGADPAKLEVTGNLKFDTSLPAGLMENGKLIRLAWGAERPVLLAGSTHEGDERAVLEAFMAVLKQVPEALLVWVPRHPERFKRATQLARESGLVVALRSEENDHKPSIQCFIVDKMGELLQYYAACDVAFVGGSLSQTGGHNVLEPAAMAKPVLVGPNTFNFKDITDQLLAAGGALRIHNARDLEQNTVALFRHPDVRDKMGQAGQDLVASGQGALERTLAIVQELLAREPAR